MPAIPSPYAPGVAESDSGAATTNVHGMYQDLLKGDPSRVQPPSFPLRLIDAFFGEAPPDDPDAPPGRRPGQDPVFTSPPFPFSDFIGPNIGVNDTSVYPLMQAIYGGKTGDWWKRSGVKIYGWIDPSITFGTSKNSNVPLSYAIVPNSLQLSQAILIFEKSPDTVQRDHMDWGFKVTNLYGIDYRYTTALGYFSDQLLKHNHLYGYDPLQMYIDIYFPKIAQGMILRLGRFISPIDIEAQLSPENYLYTHSVMYTYDPYTFTGGQGIFKLSEQYTLQLGVHGGNDMAPWTSASQVNGEILLKWVSKNGKDSLFGGVDSIGHGYYKENHDDLQVLAGTWSHKFNEEFHTMTEAYFIWERNALVGGTVTNGTPQPYYEGTGPGAKIPGLSTSYGIVNYSPYKLTDKDYIVLRNDALFDPQGYRTGYRADYYEVTLGLIHHVNKWLILRPEVRYDHSFGVAAFDNGTKPSQFTFSADAIIRF